eukprot:Awhi_evm1s8092
MGGAGLAAKKKPAESNTKDSSKSDHGVTNDQSVVEDLERQFENSRRRQYLSYSAG